jgi:hypothetical protein
MLNIKLTLLAMVGFAALATGADAAYAQRISRVTSDWESTVTEEQKLGPTSRSYRRGNAVTTTGTGWYGSRAYGRHARYRRHSTSR